MLTHLTTRLNHRKVVDTVHNLSDEPKKRTAAKRSKSRQPKVSSSVPKDTITRLEPTSTSDSVTNSFPTTDSHPVSSSPSIHHSQCSNNHHQSSSKPTPPEDIHIRRTQNIDEDDEDEDDNDVEDDVAFVDPDADEEATQLFLNMASGFRRGGHVDPKFMAGFEAMRAKVEKARDSGSKGDSELEAAEGGAEMANEVENRRVSFGEGGLVGDAAVENSIPEQRKSAHIVFIYSSRW